MNYPNGYPFKYWQEVEVLGFDGEPKYVGIFAGQGDSDRTHAIYTEDGEMHDVPVSFVRDKS